jgi:hypothetical protein
MPLLDVWKTGTQYGYGFLHIMIRGMEERIVMEAKRVVNTL